VTDPIIPDRVADELLAGEADPDTIAAQLRGVAGLTAAARQAPSEGELAGMSAAVAAFQGVVTPPVSAPGTSTRSVSYMFNTRIPKRAAIITAISVLAVGTAAAAAAGAVPSFGSFAEDVTVTTVTIVADTSTTLADSGTTTTVDGTTTTTEGSTTSTTDGATTTTGATDTTVAGEFLYPGRDYGLCTAWTHGAPKRITNPAFSYLVDEAMADAGAAAPAAGAPEAEVRAAVDSYCDKVIADKKGTPTTEVTGTTEATGTTDASSTTVAGAAHSSNGNGHANDAAGQGAGNGKGHGKP
jgi:hypothetical protein